MNRIILIASILFLSACGNGDQVEGEKMLIEEVTVEVTKHGEEITAQGALTPVEFLAQLRGKDSLEVKLAANINEVCTKKGCWMTLNLGGEESIRVTFKDYGFFVPLDAAGSLATVQGIARLDTTDVATLKHYASDAGDSKEEIDAITEPEFSYNFEATGVLIKKESITTSAEQ